MTPTQKLKWAILRLMDTQGKWAAWDRYQPDGKQIDELYQVVQDESGDDLYDAENQFRSGEVVTDIRAEYSRYYSSKSVAAKMPDGSWVGWTCWYGGGKHGEPGAMEWMPFAYDLDCVEEEKLVTVRTWTKK